MKSRIAGVRSQFERLGIDAILIASAVNRRYISGFTGSDGMVLITETDQIFLTDFRYIQQVSQQCPDFRLEQYEHSNRLERLTDVVLAAGIKRLGFEQDHETYAAVSGYRQLETEIPGLALVPVSNVVERLRVRKDEGEAALIQRAAAIADKAFDYILGVIRPGMTELEVAFELETFMRREGASGPSFTTIVASGYRSALPHGAASDKVIESGDFVTLDYGAYVNGYASDITRTVVVGEPSARQREIYEAVLQAQERALAAARPGLTGEALDAVARDSLRDRGLAEYFGHSLGHGLGMDVHEQPRVAKASHTTLESGMVITVEPGVYIADFGGVRIEDDILLTAAGSTLLTHAPKGLITV